MRWPDFIWHVTFFSFRVVHKIFPEIYEKYHHKNIFHREQYNCYLIVEVPAKLFNSGEAIEVWREGFTFIRKDTPAIYDHNNEAYNGVAGIGEAGILCPHFFHFKILFHI
uniref:Uncharacterized protein n=1 Tax=Micrurus corallinus TaxID=54390 RepID=A0A2D4F061_MICCO